MQAKRAQGLCYFCDEKYSSGHKCNLPKQMFVLELEGVKEGESDIIIENTSQEVPIF